MAKARNNNTIQRTPAESRSVKLVLSVIIIIILRIKHFVCTAYKIDN